MNSLNAIYRDSDDYDIKNISASIYSKMLQNYIQRITSSYVDIVEKENVSLRYINKMMQYFILWKHRNFGWSFDSAKYQPFSLRFGRSSGRSGLIKKYQFVQPP